MNVDEQALTLANLILHNSIWESIAVFIIVFVIVSFVKSFASTVVQYIMIKTELFGIGTEVEYNGRRAVIREIRFRWIVLKEPSTGEILYLRSNDWHKMTLVIRGSKIPE